MYTRNYGPLLFAVYDMAEGRQVQHLRQIQDQFLKELMNECGGPAPITDKEGRQSSFPVESRVRLASGEVVG